MPSLPEPVRNSLGDIVGGWSVTLTYTPESDEILLYARKQGTRWTKEKRWQTKYGPDEAEEALEAVVRITRWAAARRLF